MSVNFALLSCFLLLSQHHTLRLQYHVKNPNPSTIQYIINGVRHNITDPPNSKIEIDYKNFNPFGKWSRGPGLSDLDIKAANDAPNTNNGATVYWIYENGNLSDDVQYLGNLDADTGDNSWYSVRDRLVLSNGVTNTLNEVRLREPDTNGKFTQRYAWVGHTNTIGSISDNMWQEHYELDPRFFSYYVEDTPLDEMLRDSSFKVSVIGKSTIYNTQCIEIEFNKALLDGTHLKNDCWVDIKHDFIIRKDYEVLDKHGIPDGISDETTVPTLLNVEGGWVPSQIYRQLKTPGHSFTGQKKIIDMKSQAIITPLSKSYVWYSNPFTIQWPAGTIVTDDLTQKEFLAQADNSLTPITEVKK